MDLLAADPELKLTSAFGPQHGMRGEKQYNMVETQDYLDPRYQIPVFSLYGKVRRPTPEMMDSFDLVLFDLQDVGTRIYTFLTTLRYMLEECARFNKTIWVLDRPNPAGRPIEGHCLQPGWESFVGAGPLPMRHGLTLGECAIWLKNHLSLNVDLKVVSMAGYDPHRGPGFGWPSESHSWVNPSPNAPSLNMARCYPGTVMIEGTNLSEGRGTTKALEVCGAPDLDFQKILKWMHKTAPTWLEGGSLRHCYFQPTFYKFNAQLCQGFQFHTDNQSYQHHRFQPYRTVALAFKAIRNLYPEFQLWRDFHYEYETTKLAIDVISGGPFLRQWVDDNQAKCQDFDAVVIPDEKKWAQETAAIHIY